MTERGRAVGVAFDSGADFGRNQLVLRLRRKLGVGDLHRQHGREAFAAVVTGERDLLLAAEPAAFGEARDLARQLVERSLYASLGSDFHFPGSHAAPGSMSVVPRTAAPPIWEHPRLAHMRDAAPGMLVAG